MAGWGGVGGAAQLDAPEHAVLVREYDADPAGRGVETEEQHHASPNGASAASRPSWRATQAGPLATTSTVFPSRLDSEVRRIFEGDEPDDVKAKHYCIEQVARTSARKVFRG